MGNVNKSNCFQRLYETVLTFTGVHLGVLIMGQSIAKKSAVWIALMVLIGCGGPLYLTELVGFDAGKKTMKLSYRLEHAKLEDGRSGYQLESEVLHSVGTMSQHRTTRKALLGPQFELSQSEVTRVANDQVSYTKTRVAGSTIVIEKSQNSGPPSITKIDHPGPVYADLPPLLYANELTTPQQEKTYMVVDEAGGVITPALVRFLGPTKLFENGREIAALHFELQAITAPEEFDQYYLDPTTKKILKIQFGQIKFIPPDWVD